MYTIIFLKLPYKIIYMFQPGTLLLLMATNTVLVCEVQHLLVVYVHLFVSCENSKVQSVAIVIHVHKITFITGSQVK